MRTADAGLAPAPPIVSEVLGSSGDPIEPTTRDYMERRFGRDFAGVRVHSDGRAGESALALNARGYTVGLHIVFAPGQYAPATAAGRRLVAHELAHVVQQETSSHGATVQRQPYDPQSQQVEDMDTAAEREYANSGAPKAQTCGRPSWCPPGFCEPYKSQKLAEYYRSKNGPWIMAGIAAAVDSRVVPFWQEYLAGGSPPKNITPAFAKDFTNSPTTNKATTFLINELKSSLTAKMPAVATTASFDIKSLIPTAVDALNGPISKDRMNFSIPRDIPGNLAGDIGVNQTLCKSGAQPSPFDDERRVSGTVELARTSASEITVSPLISYTVKDTVDLCPGDCGTRLEQVATVPLSQFEATGISGDVPFTVEFPAPWLGPFTIAVPKPPSTAAPKKP
ncbi:DUF4157 domain-containing protein [Mycolicibacterium iranicum]|uniref:eCIS core domain-containing protein n=1 Tax=Mycolicibacterium iranicum TaxID=912594 RepID=A0A178LS98_MYCIR|nr:DUF4157 domain-containing protein [Mycolicibacterium iranicum]OAN36791.1 hypothetical protein A4X20_06240 [Mycolicibacterium iranicum]